MQETGWDDVARRIGLKPSDREVVRRMIIFQRIAPATLARALRGARVVAFERGDTLFNRGDPADRLFAVLEGWVKLTRTTQDGQESVIGVFARGQSFAEAAIFLGGRYPVSGSTVERSRLLVIPAADFVARLKEEPETLLNMLAAMSLHLHDLVQQVEQLSTRTSLERVAGFFASLAGGEDSLLHIRLPHDKALIAGRLGMRPETFSRALMRLREYGVEEVEGEIRIHDPQALTQLSVGGA